MNLCPITFFIQVHQNRYIYLTSLYCNILYGVPVISNIVMARFYLYIFIIWDTRLCPSSA